MWDCRTQPNHDVRQRAAALDIVANGRRLLWTDDNAIWRSGPEREQLEAAGALLISPDERRGLQPDDVTTIRAWIAAH